MVRRAQHCLRRCFGCGTIKKFITGKGNAGKPAVIAAVQALRHQPEDDNEADALALLHFAREQMIHRGQQ